MSFYHPDAYSTAPIESWWDDSARPTIPGADPLAQDRRTDIAIIGAGYTGLNAALRLRQEFGQDVTILDRATIGWGASGRNGGFCCLGGALHDLPDVEKKYGLDIAQSWARMMRQSVNHVHNLSVQHGFDLDRQSHGERAIAHKTSLVDDMPDYVALMNNRYDIIASFKDKAALIAEGANGPHFHAAVDLHHGFGLHPKKYVQALAGLAVDLGIHLHQHSDVMRVEHINGEWILSCPGGQIRAKKLLVASNGYTMEGSPGKLDRKVIPALSNILVTRPLTDQELQEQGWTSTMPTYDEGALLHYFRLLPDNRMLFGGRGGLSAAPDRVAAMRKVLRQDFYRYFPAWQDATITHEWNGLVCILRDGFPHITPMDADKGLFTALGWHGNGVAMASYGGHLAAGMMMGQDEAALAAPCRRPVPGIPLPALRPLYMQVRYAGFHFQDRLQ